MRDLLTLVFLLLLCPAVSAISGAVTSPSAGTWYQTLLKPWINSADRVFAPVRTTLYLLIALTGWRVWRTTRSPNRRAALVAFNVQLGLNLVWSFFSFGFYWIGLASIEIAGLLLAIALATAVFWHVDPLAGALFFPYLLSVAYATLPNVVVWGVN